MVLIIAGSGEDGFGAQYLDRKKRGEMRDLYTSAQDLMSTMGYVSQTSQSTTVGTVGDHPGAVLQKSALPTY